MPGPITKITARNLRLFLSAIVFMAGCEHHPFSPPDPVAAFMDKPVIIGQGVGEIEVRKTTLGEAISLLGNKFKREEAEGSFGGKCVDGVCDNNFQKFTDINLDYSDYGLMLGFRSIEDEGTPENDLKVRFVYLSCVKKSSGCAFTGKLDNGIHLGSTREEVVKVMGRGDTWTGRQGIISKRSGINLRFKSEYLKISDDDAVESLEIFSPLDYDEFQHHSI